MQKMLIFLIKISAAYLNKQYIWRIEREGRRLYIGMQSVAPGCVGWRGGRGQYLSLVLSRVGKIMLVFYLGPTKPRNLSNHMYMQARTRDKVFVKSREMTGRSQTVPW
jgi:hypothetical protein